ncbi:MAG: hypothetical protein ABSB37_13285 [Xanthobacteraceae bacterium]|jgi:hypothetical protein
MARAAKANGGNDAGMNGPQSLNAAICRAAEGFFCVIASGSEAIRPCETKVLDCFVAGSSQ